MEKGEIDVLKDNSNLSIRKIAKIINRSDCVVRNYLKNRNGYGQKSSHGRPSKLNNRGAVGYYKKAHLEIVDGRMFAVDYQQLTLTYFKDRSLPLFQNWPSKNPDMNIMENVWSYVARYEYAEGRIQFPYQIITINRVCLYLFPPV